MNLIAEKLRQGVNGQKASFALRNEGADEIERLQRIIDSRPAINAGLPETYIEWSHSIYELEAARVLLPNG